MISDHGDSHGVTDAECLIVFSARGLASPYGLRSEPVDAVVLDDQETTRSDECSEHVVVEGKLSKVVDVLIEVGGEPDVLADDFDGVLGRNAGLKHGFRNTPASCSS